MIEFKAIIRIQRNTLLCMLYLKYLKLSQRNGRITHRDTGMLISLSGNIVSTIIIRLLI